MPKKILFFCYVALTTWLALHHEPWRDEADSWLMARDASVAQILRIGPDSGHPPLWYFMLKPFTVSGLPYATQPALHLSIIWAAAWLLVFRSPFPWVVSASVLFTYFFSFEYSIIARNYASGILGIFLYCSASDGPTSGRKRRAKTLSMFIMSLASLFTLISAAILLLTEFQRWSWRRTNNSATKLPRYLWLMMIPVLIGVITLWPSGNGQFSGLIFKRVMIQAPIDSLSRSMMPLRDFQFLYAAICATWLLFVSIVIFRCQWHAALFLSMSCLSLFTLFASVHYLPNAPRYGGMVFIFAIAAIWLATAGAGQENTTRLTHRHTAWALLALFSLAQLPDAISAWSKETIFPYTDAGTVAGQLTAAGGTKKLVACSPPTSCESVLLRMPASLKFLYPGIGFGTHGFWDKQHLLASMMSSEQAVAWTKNFIHQNLPGHDGFIFMSQSALLNPESHGLKELFFSTARAWAVRDETFHIYSTVR